MSLWNSGQALTHQGIPELLMMVLADNHSLFLNRAHLKSPRAWEAIKVIFNCNILAKYVPESLPEAAFLEP